MKEVRDVANQAAQKYLEGNWAANMAIESLKQQIKVIRDRIDTVRLVKLNIHRGDTTDLIADLCELEKELLQEIKKNLSIHRDRKALISTVENPIYRALLEYRYLSFLSWDDIADKMHYDKRYLFKLHDRALNVVAVDNASIDDDRVLSIGLPPTFHSKAGRH